MKNILTIDLEDWYHGLLSQQKITKHTPEKRIIKPAYTLLKLLKQNNARATFFVLGSVANALPVLIKDISNVGHEIGIHGYSHIPVNKLDKQEFEQDIQKAKKSIKNIISKDPVSYRAPFFSLKQNMKWAFEILAHKGIKYDSSIFPAKTPLYGDKNAPRFPFWIHGQNWKIKELPLSTLKIGKFVLPIAGGFYLRALPISAINKSIKKINRQNKRFILYVHPWEIDTSQPKPKLITIRERVSHYYNLSSTFDKLTYLLKNFEFGSILDVHSSFNKLDEE